MQDYDDAVSGLSCFSPCAGPPARTAGRVPASPVRTMAPMNSFTRGGVAVDQSRSFVNVGGQHGEWVAEASFMYVGNGRGEFTPAADAEPSMLTGMGLGELEELPQLLPRLPDVRSHIPPLGGLSACLLGRQLIAWVACALVGLTAIWLLVPEHDSRMYHDLQRPAAVAEPGDVVATGREDLASIVRAVVKQQVGEPFERFDVTLDHSTGERFGFRLSSEYNSLYLAEIDYNDGLLAKWNHQHPNRELHVGDRIIQVNGVHGSSLHLLEEANKFGLANMKIMRVVDGPLQQAQPVMFYTIFLDRTNGRVFGADVVRADTSLVLKRIHGGLFGEWSKNNPETIVYPGDRIVSVNHIDGTGKKLLGECGHLRVLEMRLVRGKGSYTKHLYEDRRIINTAPWGRAWGEEDLEEVTTQHPSVPLPPTQTSTTVTATTTTVTATSTSSTSHTGTSTTVTHTTVTTTTVSTTTETRTGTETTTTTLTATVTMPPGMEYVRGLKAEFFYHIDKVHGLEILPIDQTKIKRVLEQPPDMVRIDPQVYYPLTLYGWPGVGAQDFYIARWTGQLVIKQGGNYTFQLKSDDGSDILIDGARLNGADEHSFKEHVWQAEPVVWKQMEPGGHDFLVTYFNIRLHAGIIAMYKGPDTNGHMVPIPAIAFRHRSIDLPKELLKDALYLERYDGTSRFHDSPVTYSTMFVLMGGVFLLLFTSGVFFYGTKLWRRQRDSTRRCDDLAGLIDSDRRSLRRCQLPAN